MARDSKIKDNYGIQGVPLSISYDPANKDINTRNILYRKLNRLVRRYKWHNLPEGLDGRLMELYLITCGCLVLFKYKDRYYTCFITFYPWICHNHFLWKIIFITSPA